MEVAPGEGEAPPAEEPHRATAAQQLARERGIEPDPELVLSRDPGKMGLLAGTRYVLRIRTNVVLILSSACGYYFLAGVQTFGVEFTTRQYSIDQALANLLQRTAAALQIASLSESRSYALEPASPSRH